MSKRARAERTQQKNQPAPVVWDMDEYDVSWVDGLQDALREAEVLIRQAPASPEREQWLAKVNGLLP